MSTTKPPTPASPDLGQLLGIAATIIGPSLGGALLVRALRRRERRDRVFAMLQPFLAEPMATSRRAAWAFLHAEGDDVRHFSHYVLNDPDYGEQNNGFASLLKVLLFHRTVQDLRAAGELDERLYQHLLEPHRAAWATYTARIAERSATAAAGIERGDAALFSWRHPTPAGGDGAAQA